MNKKILLATDGSGCAERALKFAASLAKCYQTQIVIVHAFMPALEPLVKNGLHNAIYENRDQAILLVDGLASSLREMGVLVVEGEVIAGPAVNVIIGAVETHRPDILVLGARGQSLWPGTQLGSVSMAVTQRVECPVLVVK
jgi:nucleotide-binding universal stress UspA family protein